MLFVKYTAGTETEFAAHFPIDFLIFPNRLLPVYMMISSLISQQLTKQRNRGMVENIMTDPQGKSIDL